MSYPFDLTNGFQKSADAPDLLKTTNKARILDQDAFNLGMGNVDDLIDSGMMARSNAAIAILENHNGRKDCKKRFEDFMLEQIRKSLEAINAEMDWLDEQIKIEETAIQANNADIDFIRTLDEDNIMGENGKPRSDVTALLKKHGYEDCDRMEADQIMLLLQTIETDLHNDNMTRQGRVDVYRTRFGDLQKSVKRFEANLPSNTPDDITQQTKTLLEREPYEVKARATRSVSETVAEVAANVEITERANNISSDFTMG